MTQKTKLCTKCKTAKPLDDFRSRYKREVAWCQHCRDIKNRAKRAANGSNEAAELTPGKVHQRQLQPGSDNEDAISRIQPTVAQEQATIEATSASISDTAFSPLTTHPESRLGLSTTSPVRVNLTAMSCSPVDRELQPKIPTASSPANLRASRYQVPVPGPYEALVFPLTPANTYSQSEFPAVSLSNHLKEHSLQSLSSGTSENDVFPSSPANPYAPIPMRVFNPLVAPTYPGLLDGPALSAADTERFRDFHEQYQSQAMQTCLQCQKPGFNMWLNSLGICAHCQEPNDVSDDTARDTEEPAKDLESDNVPTHSTIGLRDPDVALPSTEGDMVLDTDDVSRHKAQASG